MIAMWSRIKGNNLDTKMLTFIITVIVVIVASVVWHKLKVWRKRKQRRHRLKAVHKHMQRMK
jgi:p-aminobenzoyl-glutamate transporter AbgT